MQNTNTKVCIPFFQSVKGYGVFWDNYASVLFTDNCRNFNSNRWAIAPTIILCMEEMLMA